MVGVTTEGGATVAGVTVVGVLVGAGLVRGTVVVVGGGGVVATGELGALVGSLPDAAAVVVVTALPLVTAGELQAASSVTAPSVSPAMKSLRIVWPASFYRVDCASNRAACHYTMSSGQRSRPNAIPTLAQRCAKVARLYPLR